MTDWRAGDCFHERVSCSEYECSCLRQPGEYLTQLLLVVIDFLWFPGKKINMKNLLIEVISQKGRCLDLPWVGLFAQDTSTSFPCWIIAFCLFSVFWVWGPVMNYGCCEERGQLSRRSSIILVAYLSRQWLTGECRYVPAVYKFEGKWKSTCDHFSFPKLSVVVRPYCRQGFCHFCFSVKQVRKVFLQATRRKGNSHTQRGFVLQLVIPVPVVPGLIVVTEMKRGCFVLLSLQALCCVYMWADSVGPRDCSLH